MGERRSRERLEHRIFCRVDTAKFRELKQLQLRSDCRTLSELLRRILTDKKVRVIHVDGSLDAVMERLSAIRGELQHIGVNINQITRNFHQQKDDRAKIILGEMAMKEYGEAGRKVAELMLFIDENSERWLPG